MLVTDDYMGFGVTRFLMLLQQQLLQVLICMVLLFLMHVNKLRLGWSLLHQHVSMALLLRYFLPFWILIWSAFSFSLIIHILLNLLENRYICVTLLVLGCDSGMISILKHFWAINSIDLNIPSMVFHLLVLSLFCQNNCSSTSEKKSTWTRGCDIPCIYAYHKNALCIAAPRSMFIGWSSLETLSTLYPPQVHIKVLASEASKFILWNLKSIFDKFNISLQERKTFWISAHCLNTYSYRLDWSLFFFYNIIDIAMAIMYLKSGSSLFSFLDKSKDKFASAPSKTFSYWSLYKKMLHCSMWIRTIKSSLSCNLTSYFRGFWVFLLFDA